MDDPLTNDKQPEHAALARILFVGDVVGPLGLQTVEALLPSLRLEHGVDFCVANGENSLDNGAGIDISCARRLLDAGVDVITTGNHAYDAPGALELLTSDLPVVRPRNLAGPRCGSDTIVVENGGIKLGVANVIGSHEGVIANVACEDAESAVGELARTTDLILVDVHASWPAEKLALAHALSGRVCAVLGTHTHVPTADARVLPGGTAYISDVGMTGASDSVIGFRREDMVRQVQRVPTGLPAPVTSGEGVLMGVLITVAIDGRAVAIEPLSARLNSVSDGGVRQLSPPPQVLAGQEHIAAGFDGGVSAAVFDCDGLLIDSADCWRAAYERVLDAQGRCLDSDLLESLNGASVGTAASILGIDREALAAELRHAFETEPLAACPGAHALLAQLHGRIPLAVASNAPRDLVKLALRRVGLSDYLPVVLSADGRREKPAPDVYIAACERLGVSAHRAVAFEDSPVGAAAAQAGGLRLIYVPSADPGQVRPQLQARRLDEDDVLAIFGLGQLAAADDGAYDATARMVSGG